MTDRGPRPPAPDHRQHDELLVAQHAAGDPLPEPQRAEASALLATCPHCAQLAADLRSISAAVAGEPAPPRRRDFRMAPEQAERLRGNLLTRWLRRLQLPQARAFTPAAAGVLTLGLAFVVVGYAWPDGGGLELRDEDAAAPAAVSAPSPAASALSAANVRPDVLEQRLSASPVVAPAVGPVREGFLAPEPEGLAEHQAGTSAQSDAMRKALEESADTFAVDSTFADDGAVADELRASERDTSVETEEEAGLSLERSGAAAEAAAEPAVDPGGRAEPDEVADRAESAFDASIAEEAPPEAPPPEAPRAEAGQAVEPIEEPLPQAERQPEGATTDADEQTELSAAVEAGLEEPGGVGESVAVDVGRDRNALDTEATAPAADAGTDPVALLVPVGGALAIAGLVLLLLAWFARRTTDPLLR